jgi:hypothetical protein
MLQIPDLRPIWERVFTNKIGRLAKGIMGIAETDIIEFIKAAQVPHGRQITYGRSVCDTRPQKAEQYRVRLTVGSDCIDYPSETATKNYNPTTSKCLWNSTISMEAAMYMRADVKNFYLNTILDRPEFMKLTLSIIPQEIIDKYNLLEEEKNGFVYIQINKVMYWASTSRQIGKQLTCKTHGTPRVPPSPPPPPHTRTVETRHPHGNVYPGGRLFRDQVRQKVECRSPFERPQTGLQSEGRLDRRFVLWDKVILGLKKQNS